MTFFHACGCGKRHYRLVHRRWWMRLFVDRRLFQCYCCGSCLLIPMERKAPYAFSSAAA